MTLVSGKSVNRVILLAIPPTYSPASESFFHVLLKICPGKRSRNLHLICFTDLKNYIYIQVMVKIQNKTGIYQSKSDIKELQTHN